MNHRSHTRTTFARAAAALLALTLVRPLWAAPGDITRVPAPMLGSDPPDASDISDGDASVATQTGALNYSYPITVPQGRLGMQPQLALSYSSQSSTYGGVAANWTLSIPEIRLDTSESVLQQKYFANLSTDPWARERFVSSLSGSRPLVAVTETHESSVYQTYRAQNDSSWIRYERMNPGQPYLWRARSPDGVTHYFGDTALGASSPNVVLLTRSVDSFGNTIEYQWQDSQISQIRYTSNPAAGLPAFARVEFDYVTDSCGRLPSGAADEPRLDWVDGKRRLVKIRTLAVNPAGGATQHTREYTLAYDSAALACSALHAPVRMLTSIQESAWIAGQTAVALPPVTFEYNRLERTFDFPTSQSLGSLWLPDPNGDQTSLSWGHRSTTGWPTIRDMMLDFDGDGLQDRISLVSHPSECQFTWQKNRGRSPSTESIHFDAPSAPQTMPRLPWRGAQPAKVETCSLNFQFSLFQTIQDGPEPCPNSGSYLAYRWVDITGDGLVDLTAAIHHDYHLDTDLVTDPAFFTSLKIAPSWPSCQPVPDGGACPALSSTCMQAALACPDGQSCRLVDSAVSTCLAEAPSVTCDRMMKGMDQWGPADPDQNELGPIWPNGSPPSGPDCNRKKEHEKCERYPWMIYENTGGQFEAIGEVKYQPMPLESDTGDSAMGGGGGGIESQAHTLTDIDGDGYLDAVVRGRYIEDWIVPSPIWWLVFRGDGSGGFKPFDGHQPFIWYVPDNAKISGVCGGRGNACPPLSGGHHVSISTSSLVDVNGDGAVDYLWSRPNALQQFETQAFWGTGGKFSTVSSGNGPVGEPIGIGLVPLDYFQRSYINVTTAVPYGPDTGWMLSGWRQSHIQPVDVDEDGLVDLVGSNMKGYGDAPRPSTIRFNTGGSFLAPRDLASYPYLQEALVQRTAAEDNGAGTRWVTKRDLIDMDGDGLPEQWNFVDVAAGYVPIIRDESDQPLRLLKRIVNGRGGTVDVLYAPTTNVKVVTQDASVRKALPKAQWVVKSLSVSDAWDTLDVSYTNYKYKHPVWNRDERNRWGFRGFEEVTTTAPSGARTEDTYGFDVDWSGRLKASRKFSTEDTAGPRTISETTWAPLTLFSGAIKTFHTTHTRSWTCSNGQTEGQCKAANSGFLHNSWAYQQLPTTGTAQLYYANQIYNLDTESYGLGGRRNLVTMALYTDATNYRLQETGRHQVQRTSLSPFAESFFSYTLHGYDPAYKARTSTETYFDLNLPANRAVTTWHQDPATGVTDWVRSPRNFPNGPTESYLYDATKRFVTTTTNEVGHVVVSSYEPGTGALLWQRGPSSSSCGSGCTNWEQTWSDVDGLGRSIAAYANVAITGNPAWQKTKVSRTTYTDSVVSGARTKVVAENLIEYGVDRWTREETRLDGQGRPDEVIVNTDLASDAITSYDYDHRGHMVAVWMPDPSPATITGTVIYSYTYDSIGRPASMRRPPVGGTVASGIDLSYNGLVHARDEVVGSQGGPAARTVLHHDNFGRLVAVHEHTDASISDVAKTSYLYDAGDNVQRIDNPDGVVTELFHDFEDRRLRIVRNGKTWSYGYFPGGEMASEAVPPPQGGSPAAYTTTYAYDPLGRPSSRSVGIRSMTAPTEQQLFGVGTIQFTHDTCTNGAGRLCTVTFPHGVLTTTYAYDAEGNTKTETRGFNFAGTTGTRSASAVYGPGGKVAEQTYADNTIGASDATRAKFLYDDRGLPRSIDWIQAGVAGTRSAAIQSRNVAGLVTSRVAGTLVAGWRQHTSTWTYDKLTRVESQTITNNLSEQLARQQLAYFGQDDPKRLQHWMGASYYKLDFGYDRRHQLRTVKEAVNRFDAEYRFTPAGKLSYTRVSTGGTPGPGSDVIPREVNYAYSDPTNPETVTALVNVSGGANFRNYTYDSVGNMEKRTVGTTNDAFLYDGEDQLRRASVAAGSTITKEEYFYDHSGQRTAVVTRDASGAVAKVRVFLGDSEILLTPGISPKTYAHLSLGTPVARVTNRSDIEFQYQGLSSNTLLSVKPDGSTKSGFVYAPYGELLETTGTDLAEQHRRFNDKFRDDATKLSYYGVRYYDGVLLGWTQSDPLFRFAPDAAWTAPRHSDLYVFSLSNPVRYMDPDGRYPFESVVEFAYDINIPLNQTVEAIGEIKDVIDGDQSAESAVRHIASNAIRIGERRGGLVGLLAKAVGDEVDDRDDGQSTGDPVANAAAMDVSRAGHVGTVPKTPRGKGSVEPSQRDEKRRFTKEEKKEKAAEQGGKCAGCNQPLGDDAQGHHVERHADGGKTTSDNHVVVCPPCHKAVHSAD